MSRTSSLVTANKTRAWLVVLVALISAIAGSFTPSRAASPESSSMRLTVTPNAASWDLEWTSVPGARSYEIQREFTTPDFRTVVKTVATTNRTSIVIASNASLVARQLKNRLMPYSAAELFRVVARGTKGVVLGSDTATSCPELVVAGVRGSGERENWNPDPAPYTMGERGEQLWLDLLSQLNVGQSRISAIANFYIGVRMPSSINPAEDRDGWAGLLTAYNLSVSNGVETLTTAVNGALSLCPSAKIILIGYSQGADVVADYYQATPSAFPAIAQTVLIADPQKNHSDKAVMYPESNRTAKDLRQGIGAFVTTPRPQFQANEAKIVSSWCWLGDDVCNLLHNDGGNFHTGSKGDPYSDCFRRWVRWTVINGLIFNGAWPKATNPKPSEVPGWCSKRA